MGFKALLRDTVTGETRWHEEDYDHEAQGHNWAHGPPYIWAEGNFSCDHNRHLFWIRASGREETDEETDDDQCRMGPGDTVRWVVDYYLLPDGRKVPGDGAIQPSNVEPSPEGT